MNKDEINKAKDLLKYIRHFALATVNADGTPHNTPLFYALDNELKHLYFVSRDESLHTKNFIRTGKAFVVLYDSNEFNGGIYLTINSGRKLEGQELKNAYEIYNTACLRFDIDVLPENFHLQEGGYNLYAGNITKIEVYNSQDDSEGKLQQESRQQISAKELLND